MKKVFNLLFVLAIATFVVSCKCGSSADADAAKFCKCAQPMVDMQKKMKDAKPEDMASMASDIEKIQKDMETCMDMKAMQDKESKMSADEKKAYEEAIKKALNAKCPEIAKALGM